jgi:hypothetical protein
MKILLLQLLKPIQKILKSVTTTGQFAAYKTQNCENGNQYASNLTKTLWTLEEPTIVPAMLTL